MHKFKKGQVWTRGDLDYVVVKCSTCSQISPYFKLKSPSSCADCKLKLALVARPFDYALGYCGVENDTAPIRKLSKAEVLLLNY